jgi:signal peptidase I
MQEATTLPLDGGYLRDNDSHTAIDLPADTPRRRFWQWCEMGSWSVLLFVIAQTWVVQGYKVYGSCMEPNLFTGERLLGSKLSLAEGVHRGDVVVFKAPHKPRSVFIKRVVGLPGDTIEIRHNEVYVNDQRLKESYLHRTWHDERAPQRIPAGMVYVLGDNRDNSNDSRMWGFLPMKNIQAKAWVRYWPLNRLEWIR